MGFFLFFAFFFFKSEQSFSEGRSNATARFSSRCHRNTKHVEAHCDATQFPLVEHALSKRLLVAQRACAIKLDPFSYQTTSNIPTLEQHHSKSGNERNHTVDSEGKGKGHSSSISVLNASFPYFEQRILSLHHQH